MVWGPTAVRMVFCMHDKGLRERDIVKKVEAAYGVNDKTVRRCVVGLDLIKSRPNPSTETEERFGRLDGTDHYLQDLERNYWAYTHPPAIARVSFEVCSIELLDTTDQILGEGEAGTYKVFVNLHVVTSRRIRINLVDMLISGQSVDGYLIAPDVAIKGEGTYLAAFYIPPDLFLADCKAGVVIYADGQGYNSENKESLTFYEPHEGRSSDIRTMFVGA